jgi:hypothetical protein
MAESRACETVLTQTPTSLNVVLPRKPYNLFYRIPAALIARSLARVTIRALQSVQLSYRWGFRPDDYWANQYQVILDPSTDVLAEIDSRCEATPSADLFLRVVASSATLANISLRTEGAFIIFRPCCPVYYAHGHTCADTRVCEARNVTLSITAPFYEDSYVATALTSPVYTIRVPDNYSAIVQVSVDSDRDLYLRGNGVVAAPSNFLTLPRRLFTVAVFCANGSGSSYSNTSVTTSQPSARYNVSLRLSSELRLGTLATVDGLSLSTTACAGLLPCVTDVPWAAVSGYNMNVSLGPLQLVRYRIAHPGPDFVTSAPLLQLALNSSNRISVDVWEQSAGTQAANPVEGSLSTTLNLSTCYDPDPTAPLVFIVSITAASTGSNSVSLAGQLVQGGLPYHAISLRVWSARAHIADKACTSAARDSPCLCHERHPRPRWQCRSVQRHCDLVIRFLSHCFPRATPAGHVQR